MRHVITWQDRAHTREVGPANLDAETLAQELRSTIRGEVRFDEGSRALYATDGSNYRQVPIGVVLPKDVEDVIATVAVCRGSGAPLLARGGGTSLAGQCCNIAVVLDLSKYMHSVLEIDPHKKLDGCSRARFSITCAMRRSTTISRLGQTPQRILSVLWGA